MLQPFFALIQETAAAAPALDQNLARFGAALGVALAVIGAGYGISRIGSAAVEGMARQPEAAGSIQTASLILSALIEGAALFGLVILLLMVL